MKRISTLILAGATVLAAVAAPVKVGQVQKQDWKLFPERSVVANHEASVKKARAEKKADLVAKKRSHFASHRTGVLTEEQIANARAKKAVVRKEAGEIEVLIDETFACLTEGSPEEPVLIETDDFYNIPVEIIGEKNYGFGGDEIYQAGGQLYLGAGDEDSNYSGELWTPDFSVPGTYYVSFDVKIADDTEEAYLAVDADDYEGSLGYTEQFIYNGDWTHFECELNCLDATSDLYFDIYTYYYKAPLLIKNFKIEAELPAILAPTALDYTDFTGTGFTANWDEVEGATAYLLTLCTFDGEVYDVDEELETITVEGTSYTFTDLDPERFYCYVLQATDGVNISDYSNVVPVLELLPVTNVTLTVDEDLPGIRASWDAPYNANYYLAFAQRMAAVKEGDMVTLAEADFSDVVSDGTLEEPEEDPDYFTVSFDQLPGWQLGCPAYVDGAVGMLDNWYYTLFGYGSYLQSDTYNLAALKDGKVNLTISAASADSDMLTYLLVNEDGEWVTADYVITEITDEFAEYDVTLTGCTDECCIYIRTCKFDDEGYLDDGSLFIRNMKVWGVAGENGFVGIPMNTVQGEDTSCEFETPLHNGDAYEVKVKPYAIDPDYYIIASGPESAPARITVEVDGVENIATASQKADARFFNLQGMPVANPEAGNVYIRVANGKATKIVR